MVGWHHRSHCCNVIESPSPPWHFMKKFVLLIVGFLLLIPSAFMSKVKGCFVREKVPTRRAVLSMTFKHQHCQGQPERVRPFWCWSQAIPFAFHCVGDYLIESKLSGANVATDIIECKTTCALETGTQKFNFSFLTYLLGDLGMAPSPLWTSSMKC